MNVINVIKTIQSRGNHEAPPNLFRQYGEAKVIYMYTEVITIAVNTNFQTCAWAKRMASWNMDRFGAEKPNSGFSSRFSNLFCISISSLNPPSMLSSPIRVRC